MALPLDTALGAMIAVPAVIALTQGSKDKGTRVMLFVLVALSVVVALTPFVDVLRDYLNGNLRIALAVAAGILGVVTAIRIPNHVLSTLIIAGGGLLALVALHVIG